MKYLLAIFWPISLNHILLASASSTKGAVRVQPLLLRYSARNAQSNYQDKDINWDYQWPPHNTTSTSSARKADL